MPTLKFSDESNCISVCFFPNARNLFKKRALSTDSSSSTFPGTPPCLSDRWMLAFIACFVTIETIICAIISLTAPDSGLVDVVYSDMKNEAYIQCTLVSYTNYNMALWWGYNSGLVLVCTYQAFLTRKVPGNYNEAQFIAFNMMTISTDVLMFFLSHYGTKTYYKDILVSSFLIIADSVTITCMFLPKVYVIVFRPQKNVEYRSAVSLGTLDNEEEENERKISTRSNVSVLSSLSYASSSLGDAKENFAYDENGREGVTRKVSSITSNGSAGGDSDLDSLDQRRTITSRDSNLSTRTVRFEDEIDFDFVPHPPNCNDNFTAKFEYRRRESTI